MANIDDVFAAIPDAQAITVDDSVDFVIDSNLRVISIPVRGVVLGVEGDKDVNRVTFLMPKMYKGVDLSTFQIRVNYANANGEKNFFKVTETSVADDQIRFIWVVAADAVAYKGDIEFVVRFVKLNGSTVVQELNTTLATAKSLIGLSVDSEITPVQREDLLAHFYSEIDTYSEQKKNEILGSIPSDYTQMSNNVNSLKQDKVDKPSIADNNKIPRANNGEVKWVEVGQPTDEQTDNAVTRWLNEHPESTTTVQDGSITDSKFSIDLQKKKANYYNSVHDMKNDLLLVAGMKAITLGYYTQGDLGGAVYYVRKRANNDSENLGNVFIRNNLIAVLILKGLKKFNICQLGIIPNTDEDLSDKFQSILDTRVHNAEFYFPSGEYKFNKPIVLKQVTTLIGDMFCDAPNLLYDINGTSFIFAGSLFENKICIDGSTTATSGRNKITGIKFISDSFSMSEDRNKLLTNDEVYNKNINFENVSCISLRTGSTIENCFFSGFSGQCIKVLGAYCLFNKLLFTNCNIGLNTHIDNRFINLRFELINVCILLDGSANIIDDIRADSISENVVLCEKKSNINHNTLTNIFADFCYKTPFVLRGSFNFIRTEIGRCCAKQHDRNATDITNDELVESCAICFSGSGTVNSGNKIECVISQSNVLDKDKTAISPPIFLGVVDGDFYNNVIDITCNTEIKMEDIVGNDLNKKLKIIKLHASPSKYIKLDCFKIIINNISLNALNCYIPENNTKSGAESEYFMCNKFSLNNILVNYTDVTRTPTDIFMFMRKDGKLYISDVVNGVLSWVEV